MLYLIRQPSGEYIASEGSYVEPDGTVHLLKEDQFEIEPTGYTWESEATGGIYPLEWDISVPRWNIDIRVSPVLDDQEMDTRASTGIVYWEGAMNIDGSHDGLGYMELTNYNLYPFGQTDENTPLVPLLGPLGG
jgi:predicted secreted hydrolase